MAVPHRPPPLSSSHHGVPPSPPPPLQAAAFSARERKRDELDAEGRGREERWRAVMEEARGMADAQLEMSNRKW